MTALRVLPWAMLLGLVAFAVGTYDVLPAEIPTHVNLDGVPTNLVAKSVGRWMLLPLVALGALVLLSGIAAVLPRHPELFNFPEKDRLLALPKAYQAAAVAWMRVVLDVAAIMMLLIVGYVQWMLWRTALGHRESSGLAVILIGSAVMTPAILILISKVNDATVDAERRWKEAGSPPA